MTTAPSLQAVAGRATADARIPPSCTLVGGASREAVKRWAGASRDALLLTLALARWLAACRGGAAAAVREPVPAARAASAGVPLRRGSRRPRPAGAHDRGLSPANARAGRAALRARGGGVGPVRERDCRGRGEGAKNARAELASAVPRAPGARAPGRRRARRRGRRLRPRRRAGRRGWAVGGGAAAAAAPLAAALRAAAQRLNRDAPRRFRAAAEAALAARGFAVVGAPRDRELRAWPAAHARRTWGVEVVVGAKRGAAAGLERRCGVGDVEVPSAWGIGSRPRPPFDTQRAAAASRRFVHAAPWRRSCRGGTMLGAWRLRAAA